MRKLVTKRKITNITPIKGADFIERLTIDGWHCVGKKGEFSVGDDCLYFEIDSFLPESDERFAFLMKAGVRTFNGHKGHRLRTIRLRKQISQGLALPMGLFPEVEKLTNEDDIAKHIGVEKWEAPVPACIAGEIEGNFPSFIPKTDEERAQNIEDEILVENKDAEYEVTVKLDGTSMTAYVCDWNKNTSGVCMRNWELKINEQNKENTLVKMSQGGLLEAMKSSGINVAVQGELMGEGIQKNRESIKGHKFFVFNIYLIDEKRYMTPSERKAFFGNNITDVENVEHVPVFSKSMTTNDFTSVDELIDFAEGESINNPVREGLVWKRLDGGFSFKTISNKFLEKEE